MGLDPAQRARVQRMNIRFIPITETSSDIASRGPTTIVAPESQFRTCPTDHDSIGYPRMSASGESSTTMHRPLHASGSHQIPPPDDPKTNQYNQDLGLIHSTNGNHLESPKEGSSIDHQENGIFTAPKQFLKEPLRSGEDDDMSGSKQPSKIIEPAAAETDKEIEPVATEDLSLAKSVATMTDSEDTEPLSKVLELTDKSKSDEESMSIEDILKQIPEEMMLPSVTVAEITRIKFGLGIEIPGVNEGDWYKASLPRIATSDKGKAPFVAKDEIKGHPARDMFNLICADIDFLIQLRENVIADVVSFFHYFSFSRLAVFGSVKDIVAKEEQISVHTDPDSLSTSSTSTSPMDFVADIPQLEQSPAASTQILMPTTAIPSTDFPESFAQLTASVTQLSIK
ncbi:splicing factor 3B subunit 1-like [Dorcoceras hygrometricum]|uniref:Splicing factor 3B subunit 1-like n=1 Tax=Dorcoceras hygrometricum TaxID=472368 RepID=A0A2Z7BPA9_9LAMI|nr:splicing factor 3B subunit 1-like [Dorcoceras hygrometricum]